VDSINITVTGRLGADPRQGTTKAGKPWASFTLAADVPTRNGSGDREYETRWHQVWCHGPLAEHAADPLAKGDRVTVRADDVTCRTWTEDAPGHRGRGQVELKAYDVSLSLRFANAVAVRAPSAEAAPAGAASARPTRGPTADRSPPPPRSPRPSPGSPANPQSSGTGAKRARPAPFRPSHPDPITGRFSSCPTPENSPRARSPRNSSAASLLAVVPPLLGFDPSEPSLVVVGIGPPRAEVRITLRFDIPLASRNATAWLALVLDDLPVRDDAWARMDPDLLRLLQECLARVPGGDDGEDGQDEGRDRAYEVRTEKGHGVQAAHWADARSPTTWLDREVSTTQSNMGQENASPESATLPVN